MYGIEQGIAYGNTVRVTDDPLAAVRAAAAQYNALVDADELLKQSVVAALKDGQRPADVVDASTRDRDTIRRWAREAGIPPAPRGGGRRRRSAGAEVSRP
jgi:FAD/FMN-containing dehydrogenase